MCTGERGAAASSALGEQPFVNTAKGYQINIPSGWRSKQKSGADVLFEDPDRPSSTLGVTVAPVRVQTLAAFGDVGVVAEKLVAAEKNKARFLGCTAPPERPSANPGLPLSHDMRQAPSQVASTLQESTLAVDLLAQRSRAQEDGKVLYEYEYELASTRGRKRILNSVSITAGRLIIVNAQCKCGTETCSAEGEDVAAVLRQSVATFAVL